MVKTSMSSSAMMTSTCTVSGSDVSSRTSRCHIQAVLLEGGTAPEFPYRWNTAANERHAATDPGHPVYNAIPGRYANRIGNAEFELDGETYKLEANDGVNTLHSGTNNWSFREWNVTDVTDESITFSIYDPELSLIHI